MKPFTLSAFMFIPAMVVSTYLPYLPSSDMGSPSTSNRNHLRTQQNVESEPLLGDPYSGFPSQGLPESLSDLDSLDDGAESSDDEIRSQIDSESSDDEAEFSDDEAEFSGNQAEFSGGGAEFSGNGAELSVNSGGVRGVSNDSFM